MGKIEFQYWHKHIVIFYKYDLHLNFIKGQADLSKYEQ